MSGVGGGTNGLQPIGVTLLDPSEHKQWIDKCYFFYFMRKYFPLSLYFTTFNLI